MRTRGISRPTVVLGLLLPVVACVPSLKPLPRAELERPQKVVLVTVARDPAAVSNWHPGLSLGLGFGSFGSSVSGGVDLSQQRDPFSAAVVEDLKSWDFRPALQRVMLARPAPGAWTWVDGDSLDGAVLNEIDAAHGKPNAPMPLTQAWADKNGVDKILVVDPASWGVKSEEGFFVELAAELLQPADRRTVLWEGRGRPSHPRRPFFVAGAPLGPKEREGIHQAVLDSAAESADNLLNALRKSAE